MFYLYANTKIEIQICSNKHETGLVKEAYLELYADDATVHTSSKQSSVVESRLQAGAIDFKIWCILHRMFIHIGKTSVMLSGTRQTLQSNDPIAIYLDNELIKSVDFKSSLV